MGSTTWAQKRTQPIYDRLRVSGNVEALSFCQHVVGFDGVSWETTNMQTHELLFHDFEVQGVTHRVIPPAKGGTPGLPLAGACLRARTLWSTMALDGIFRFRVADRMMLELPLTSLPLLDLFESPFTEVYDVPNEHMVRRNFWPVTFLIKRHMPIRPEIRFRSLHTVDPAEGFDIQLIILGNMSVETY